VSQSRVKPILIFTLKLAVAGALIGWLIRGGRIDFSKLKVLFEQPSLLAMDLGLFLLGVVLTGLRWRVLLQLVGVTLPLGRVFQLQLTALFFNVVIPGNVGGDVVKALYASRSATPPQRTAVLLIVLLERALGLAGLILIATLVTLARWDSLWSNPLERPLVGAVLVLGALVVVGGGGLFLAVRHAGARLESWANGTTRLAKLLTRGIAAMRLLASSRRALASALGLSMIAHAAAIGFVTVLTVVLTSQDVSFATVASIFPLGLLSLILPISPSGLGVGHVVFERLYASAGLTGGATIFNVYLLGQIVPCLLGVFPYLTLKRRSELPETS
jgi:uncharacterized protein (TIRG00374 family)